VSLAPAASSRGAAQGHEDRAQASGAVSERVEPAARSDPSATPAPAAVSLGGSTGTGTLARALPGERAPSRVGVLLVGLLLLLGLVAATSYKVVTRPGRTLPAYNVKLRALPPPTSAAEPDERQDSGPAPSDAAVAAPAADLHPATARPGPVTKSGPKPEPKPEPKVPPPAPKPKPALGPPPSSAEIRACIDRRRPRIRACADEAAQRMEGSPGGTARATLKPDGRFTNLRIPGGDYFVDCTARIIRALRCRAFQGTPIEVAYPLR